MNQSLTSYRNKKYEDARNNAGWAIKFSPDSSLGYRTRAMSEDLLGEDQKGFSDINEAMKHDQEPPFSYIIRAQFEERLGNSSAADEDYKYAEERNKDTTWYFSLARHHFAKGDYRKASDELRAYCIYNNDPYARLWLYFSEWKHDGKDAALAHLKSFVENSAGENLKFAGRIIKYLTGGSTEGELMDNAALPVDQSEKENLCEANFYIGMNHLLNGDITETKSRWIKSLGTMVTTFIEFMYVEAHLREL